MWFVLTIQLAAIIEEVKRELNLSDKALAFDLGYDTAAEYSKGKHGVRPMPVERWLNARSPVLKAFLRAVARAHAEQDLPAAAHYPDADLLDDIAAKLQALRRRMAKAELRDDAERGEVA